MTEEIKFNIYPGNEPHRKETHEEIEAATQEFLKRGGKIKKLPPLQIEGKCDLDQERILSYISDSGRRVPKLFPPGYRG